MAKKSLVTKINDAELKLLRVFQTVAESGGLAAAEPELNIGRSTISKQVADLEFRLGLKLCHRGPAGFALTEDGERLMEAADRLLTSVSEFRAEVNDIKQTLVGTIRIAMFDLCISNPESHLPQAIHNFNKAAPNVEIDLSLEPPTVIEPRLLGGQLDIGILAQHRPSSSLDYLPLYGEDMYLYCGRDHPFFERPRQSLTLEEVRSVSYAGISANSPNLHVGQRLGFRRTATVQSEHALLILILSGRYIGFLPDHLTKTFVEEGRMQTLLPKKVHFRTEFSAAVRRNPAPNRITSLFLERLKYVHP